MSEPLGIQYVFGTKPSNPIGIIQPKALGDLQSVGLMFSGVVSGHPSAVARFLRELANQAEMIEASEITIRVEGPSDLMPKVQGPQVWA